MAQEDLFKRHIELLGRILGKIFFNSLGFKTGGDVSQKIENIQGQVKSEVDLDIEELTTKPFDQFIEHIIGDKRWSEENLSKFADILLEMSNLIDEQKNLQAKKIRLLNFALSIYEHINTTSLVYSYDRNSKIEKIRALLKRD